ncbi:FeoA family protein [Acinetobacter populi]|uniref:Ferrous iron transport protein A n=1 Tax=Acinetobacter populi TaxID=1582270 RepID=A0A1Z9Z353_9GAMM|nr:FeoA family protein [Acinetobacter populi]MCH4246661.1 ferrous iron transport protein A [Acinetobacter populi]OUY08876.1 ferrous iron transport protein A [Acinetobacter populi]
MRLTELKTKQPAIINQIYHLNRSQDGGEDGIATRLMSLGFVPGEKIEVLTRGLFGGEPILVKVGFSRFALRRNEADRIEVNV